MIRTLLHRAFLVTLLLCLTTAGHAAVDDLTRVVPAGVPMVAYVTDVPDAMSQWDASPLAELWNDPQVRKFFAPLRKELEADRLDEKIREQTGFDLDEIKEMLTGDLVVFIDDLEIVLEDGEEDLDLSVTLLATVGENAGRVEQMLLEAETGDIDLEEDEDEDTTTSEVREFRGVDLHIKSEVEGGEGIEEIGWATVDGVLAVASPVVSLERAVAGILDGGIDNSLRSGANFGTITEHIDAADSWFFVDVHAWLPLLRTAMDEGLAAAQGAGNPFPVEQTRLMTALGVEAMQAIFGSFNFNDRIMEMNLGITFTENRGLIKLAAYGPDTAPRPTSIPVDSDSFTTASFDFQSSWAALVEIVNGINPSLMGMAAMQLQSMTQNAGVELDLRRDLLENLTGEMASIQNIDGITGDTFADLQIEQDQVFSFGIHQPEALANAIGVIEEMAGGGAEFFSSREFEGHTIFTLDLPRAEGEKPGSQFAYAVTDGHLLISVGSPATLEEVLLKLGKSKPSVWKLPEVRRALGKLGEGAAVVQYQDLRSVGDMVFHAIALADGFRPGDGEDVRICDPSAIPDPGIVGRYLASGVSGVWKNDREMVVRALVLPAEKD